ncbi:MAG TPA: CbiX/SirB N-terminal domain-containing protein [Acidobacteriota bacterium]|nr:CbiX/SirB N-terminal domain-containing protein [Acidobacteriota bacterium]
MSSRPASHAFIVAAHGSRRQTQANRLVQRHAQRLGREFGLGRVQAAFQQGPPSFAEVLDEAPADRYTVLPLFTAAGYYTRRVLPRELAKNSRFRPGRVHIVPPLGLRPEVLALAHQRSRILLNRFGLSGGHTTLIIIGHGTRRHSNSRASTLQLVEHLRRAGSLGQVLPAFLDDSPSIEEAFAQAKGEAVVLLPFLIGGTFHALRDIPQALGLNGTAPRILPSQSETRQDDLPAALLRGDRLLLFDRPIGEDPSIANILARMATESPWAADLRPRGAPAITPPVLWPREAAHAP